MCWTGDREEWLVIEYILKLETTRFSDLFAMEVDQKGGIKDN